MVWEKFLGQHFFLFCVLSLHSSTYALMMQTVQNEPTNRCIRLKLPHAGPTPKQIEEGVQFALDQAAQGRAVLIHCAHGHGRSATLLAAILIADGSAVSIEEAEKVMKRSRPRVRLNRRQRAALKQWLANRKQQL